MFQAKGILLLFSALLPLLTEAVIRHKFWEDEGRSCFKTAAVKWPPQNKKYFANGKEMFYPLMSRLDLNRVGAALLDIPVNDVEEHRLYYDACIKANWNFETGKAQMKGFGGKEDNFPIPTHLPGNYTSPPDSGTMYLTLTDDSTFAFFATCTHDDRRTWYVVSKEPKLPADVIQKIKNHAEEIGFNWQYSAQIRYDHCK